jgi:methylglutaconyl-CoA hydratase
MPPPLRFRLPPLLRAAPPRRCYSALSKPGDIIRVTNLPAPTGGGHIRVLELNRPDARNAISRALLNNLAQHVDDVTRQYNEVDGKPIDARISLRDGPTQALIIASAVDSSFCAGADLKERRGFTPDQTGQFLKDLRKTFASLASVPIPTISAISSVALGGGLELALSTHFRVLTSNAVVGLPETRLAIIPGAGGTYRLPAVVGVQRAREMILTGRRVPAQEAYLIGLADRLVEVVPDAGADDLLPAARAAALAEAIRLAQQITEGGPVAVRAALKALEEPSYQQENKCYHRVVDTEDRNEALLAFQEKRKPIFKGK